jgi:hypothetical protein
LATLGIAVPGSNFDSPSPLDHVNNNNPSVLSAGDSATIAPAVLPNKETGRTAHQNHGIYISFSFYFENDFIVIYTI